jgi:DNA-binding transcriptional LysR family regulator
VTPPAAGGDDPSKDAQRPTVPVLVPVAGLNRAYAEHEPRAPGAEVPLSLELRHLRYFVALADTGNFTRAAEQLFIAQPTLSQQIRRLEGIVGTPLLRRRREGLKLTAAGRVLLDTSRSVLAQVDQAVSQTRQVAGLGRPRLRVVLPPCPPEFLAAAAAAGLQAAAAAAEVDVAWLETQLDEEFSLISTRRADAGLGWLTTGPDALPAVLEAMVLGEFEPQVWGASTHTAARRGTISLEELAGMAVIYGPRQLEPVTYDAWSAVLRAVDPRFEFTDPPLRCSLPVTLAFAATWDRPAAVLTGPAAVADSPGQRLRLSGLEDSSGMVRVSLRHHPLTASAALVWNGGLTRPLQQILFDTADSLAKPDALQPAGLAS